MARPRIHPFDVTGQKFGRLTAIKIVDEVRTGYKWLFYCDCGNQIVAYISNVRRLHTKSCGCLHREKMFITFVKHRMTGTRFYGIWKHIRQRCLNPKVKTYRYYGGRGIKNFWQSFEEFRDDMYKSYQSHVKKFGEKNTTIERINNNGDYCKENCKWATYFEQARNRSNSLHTDI